jgi:hypothetical protein
MMAVGAAALVTVMMIDDGFVALIVVGLAGLGVLLLALNSRSHWPAEGSDGHAARGGKIAAAPIGRGRQARSGSR